MKTIKLDQLGPVPSSELIRAHLLDHRVNGDRRIAAAELIAQGDLEVAADQGGSVVLKRD